MSDKEYITVAGLVQFDPAPRVAAGKDVRDVVVKAIGNNKKISITVWPSHKHVNISKGDFIVADGEYTQVPKQNAEGETVIYHNLSAYTLVTFTGEGTPANSGAATKSAEPSPAEPTSEEDWPF